MSVFRTLLVPTDFSDASLRAYEVALELARRLSARVVLLHCYAINPGGISPYGVVLPEAADAGLRDAAQQALEVWREKASTEGVEVDMRLGTEPPALGIAEAIEATGADLVVMATHIREGLARIALGSVAATTLRTAQVPVLTVRPEDDAEDFHV